MEDSERKPREIKMTQEEWENQKDKITETPSLLPYAHTIGGALIKPEDKGRIKGLSVSAMYEQSNVQLTQIYGQIQTLMNQANEIKTRVEISERIYQANLGFKPLIGNIYYLYQKKNGQDVLSMVGPAEWGETIPFESYISTVKLLSDHTWEIIETMVHESDH